MLTLASAMKPLTIRGGRLARLSLGALDEGVETRRGSGHQSIRGFLPSISIKYTYLIGRIEPRSNRFRLSAFESPIYRGVIGTKLNTRMDFNNPNYYVFMVCQTNYAPHGGS